jgi:hypothetical protein
MVSDFFAEINSPLLLLLAFWLILEQSADALSRCKCLDYH